MQCDNIAPAFFIGEIACKPANSPLTCFPFVYRHFHHANKQHTLLLVRAAKFALDRIFRESFKYKRAGGLLGGLVNQSTGQMSLFDTVDHAKHERLMSALDTLNTRFGRNTVRTAAQTIGGSVRLTQQNRLSPCYTTKWRDALRVNVGFKSDLWIPGRG